MKFNWGVGITIVIIAFITFILSFVYKASQTDTDLTSEDYYEQEINYQETIEAKNNAVGIKNEFEISQSDEYFIVKFPADHANVSEGSVHFYRPENAELDKTYKLELSNGMMAFPKKSLTPGGYKLTISWKNDNKAYLIENQITIE